ncbi:MAG: methyl-accepting chemotaxis protein [Deltaproteobacteria bacterium]|nr:methyl-accepting chemotaxis protein [Deltaproteobacteria bacterium]
MAEQQQSSASLSDSGPSLKWVSPKWSALAVGGALLLSFGATMSVSNQTSSRYETSHQQLAQEVAARFHMHFSGASTSLTRTQQAEELSSPQHQVRFFAEGEASPLQQAAEASNPVVRRGSFLDGTGIQILWNEAGKGAQAALVPSALQPAGTVEVWVPISSPPSNAFAWLSWFLLVGSFAAAAFAFREALQTARSPLGWATQSLEALAAGVMDPLPASAGGAGVQGSPLERAFETVRSKWKSLLEEMQQDSSSVKDAAADLSTLHFTVQSGLGEINGNTRYVTTVAGTVKSSVSQMADAVTGTSIEVKTVAAGADKMTAAVGDIASSVTDMNGKVNACSKSAIALSKTLAGVVQSGESAAQETARAQEAASRAYEIMGRLQKSAEEIDNVIEVISAIAAKTNLLALNAAIEAASAGNSGSGFAVVAGEVKNLANQTAKATTGVMDNVEGIRRSTRDAVVAIEEIVSVVDDVKDATDSIASAVSEQRERADTMAAVILEASESADHIRSSVDEIHDGVRTVAGSASEISNNVEDLANQLSSASIEMEGMVQNLEGVSNEMETLSQQAGNMDDATTQMKEKVGHLLSTSGAFVN